MGKKLVRLMLVLFAVFSVGGLCLADGPVPGLIAHWDFDEGEGTTAYDSAGSNHGTLVNGPIWAAGIIGEALEFDGSDDYVSIPDSAVFDFGNGDFSIALWFKTDGPSNSWQEQFMVNFRQNDNSPHIEIYTAGDRLGTHLLPYSARITGGYVEDSQWHHAAITMDNGATNGYKLYLDGVNAGQRTYSGTLSNWHTLKVGGDFQGPGTGRREYFRGLIDDVMIYDRALSDAEIEALYRGQLLGLEVIGPYEVAEDFQAQYKAIANYERVDIDVTDSSVWSCEPDTVASIASGLLSAGEVEGDTELMVYSEYPETGVTVDGQKEVMVLNICPSGSALSFEGDYVNCGNNNSLELAPAGFTVKAWVKLKPSASNKWLVAKGRWSNDLNGDYWLNLHPGNNNLNFAIMTSAGYYRSAQYSYSMEQWFHVTGVFGGSSVALYVNGQLVGTPTAVAGSIGTNGHIVQIGGDPSNHASFNGLIDEVAIYNRALSAEDIQATMHAKLIGEEPNLVGCWNFDEGEGQIAYDLSINANHGTLGSGLSEDGSDPIWVASDAPVGDCAMAVSVDIKPSSCPNPMNVVSKGVLPVAVLGTADFDVHEIEAASVRLAGVAAIRNSYEDVSSPASDSNECDCEHTASDGFADLTLKFRTQDIVGGLLGLDGGVESGDVFSLELTGVLSDGTKIEGSDCVVILGKVPRSLEASGVDINGDGRINMVDFGKIAEFWLESAAMK